MPVFLKHYLTALPVFFVIDMLWLGLVARKFYSAQIGFLMKESTNWLAAILFYLLFIGGLVFFVISPAVAQGSWLRALWVGALFGLITYATYDLTNLATLKGWPVLMVVVDMIWGMVLSASVSVVSTLIVLRLGA